MPSATTPLQITIPISDPYFLTSYNLLNQYTQEQLPNTWLHSIEQILTNSESQWTPISTFFSHNSTNNQNIITNILQNGTITLLINENTTPDWNGINPHPLHNNPSEIFNNEYITSLQYQTTQN